MVLPRPKQVGLTHTDKIRVTGSKGVSCPEALRGGAGLATATGRGLVV